MFSPIMLGTGLTGYQYLQRTRDQQTELMAKSPEIARDTQAFRDRIGGIQGVDDLMEDRALLKVALGAFGLQDDLQNTAFIRKVLSSDLADEQSFANKLADKRYLGLAKAFGFSEGRATLDGLPTGDNVLADLAEIRSAKDLLDDPALLRATLDHFGLGADIGNTYFLEKVLESDPTDPASFAARLSNPAYAELAAAFDLTGKLAGEQTIYGFARLFETAADDLRTPEDLFDQPDLLAEALRIFGLEDDIDRPEFLAEVLASDLDDDTSVANMQDDQRYAALAGVFDFHARAAAELAGDDTFETTLQKTVRLVGERDAPIAAPGDLSRDTPLMLAVHEFFGLRVNQSSASLSTRMLSSDLSSPTSLANVYPDKRYLAFAKAFHFEAEDAPHTYPPGFADAVVETYLGRQFEIAVGEGDSALRLALSMERELKGIVDGATSESARWYGVLSSAPMRSLFETAFQMPSAFSALDIDRQVEVLRERTEANFGTDRVADLLQTEPIDKLRRLYLLQAEIQQLTAQFTTTPAMSLLAQSIR